MYRLKGRVQSYAWGGNHFIPDLFHLEVDRAKPSAEYWLGVHPGGQTEIELPSGEKTTLASFIETNKEKYLGKKVTQQFGRLPFLLKVLDVKDMLSIQVHPTKSAAEAGFSEENRKSIPLTAPNRNYKDDNHKPEVMIALSDFWLLHGFAENIPERLEKYSFLHPFTPSFERGGIKGLYQHLMELSDRETEAILKPLASNILPLYRKGELEKRSPHFWAARAFENLCAEGQFDKGIFSIYLFNILHLKPGEGIFQGAGMPHAYLEGQNIELMSNSDNVLRAGLTPKYVDIPELLKNTLFIPTQPKIIKLEQNTDQQVYPCPVQDFSIEAFNLKKGTKKSLKTSNPSILLFVHGQASMEKKKVERIDSADAYFLPPDEELFIEASTDLYFVLATVP